MTFFIGVSNEPRQGEDFFTLYNVQVTDILDPVFRIDSVSSGAGSVTINGQEVVVNGGITLGLLGNFAITINCTIVDGAGQEVINDARLDYTNADGTPQPPYRVQDPVVITIEEAAPVVPEASTLILLGGAVAGLAGFVGLQIKARRRDRR